ncbi:hypothetical protein [Nocardia puris]|uniref:MspA protein n=1 Tax=Nocardia puris TaxID=208602 RepID=A0A366D6F8_9NOCA|nr:hypothetical protein [Nocardia puris]RBO85632.1 hypothetical protein DFR74_114175 [Nocardia puris]
MASTSLPLAAAAAVATLLAAPAGAVPNDPTTPTTPAPAQPGTGESDENTPGDERERPGQGGQNNPTPSQPGVSTPDPNQVMPEQPQDPRLATPTQPGVTPPRVAPLPVPGQPAANTENEGAEPTPVQPGTTSPDAPEGGQAENPDAPAAGADEDDEASAAQPEQPSGADTLVQEPRWEAPRHEAAPAAPVVEMTGPHQEIGASVDGGTLLPGHVANTHHFSNEAGYVGTIGYSTPTGRGEAGVSVEFVDVNTIKVASFTGGEGLPDNQSSFVVDTTQVNLAKAAVEQWIAQQPGGAAALEAASQVKLPTIVPAGDLAPQTVNVAGVTTQWGGSFQY